MSNVESENIEEEEEITVEVRKPLSTVFSVRFTPKELALIRAEADRTGIKMGALIKESVRQYVASRVASRRLAKRMVGLQQGLGYYGFDPKYEDTTGYLSDLVLRHEVPWHEALTA